MPKKNCSRCEQAAEFSLCFVVSSLGRSPRVQKCTESLNLCTACIQNFCGGLQLISPPRLAESLRAAYTTFTRHSELGANRAGVQTARPGNEREGSHLVDKVCRELGS